MVARITMRVIGHLGLEASLAQLAEHALRKRMVVGSIPTEAWAIRLQANTHVSSLANRIDITFNVLQMLAWPNG